MKVLIVDDDVVTLTMIKGFLAPYGECENALNGEEALEVFVRNLNTGNGFNLIILDISMPGMDGHEVLSVIRKTEDERNLNSKKRVKVFMSTAGSTKQNLMKAFIGQCDAYLPKPISKNELLKHAYKQGIIDADAIVRDLLKI